MSTHCDACGGSLPGGARFCPGCGRPLVAAASPAAAEAGERRQLTVMFCDLVGSTELGQRLDPEDLTELIGSYQQTCATQIERYDGHVAQYLGDGILVYFGYPTAHENDAERAVRAGLAIQAALAERRAAASAADVRLEARIGIHTGPVVVSQLGGGGRRETLAIGDTMNLAARIQAHAEPGAVLISAATLRLAAGLFETEDLGPVPLKGAAPLVLHRVVRQTGVHGRLHGRTRTPLVGRGAELALLLERWRDAERGDGQVVVLSGDPGLGKSRLLHDLRQQLADRPHSWLDATCSPFSSGAAFQPITELVARGLAMGVADATPAERLAALETLALPDVAPETVVPYLAALLQLPPSARFPLPQLAPALQRERTLAALAAIYRGLAALQPVVLCVEDVHWVDPSTRELLHLLIDQAAAVRGLLLIAGRPEIWADWALDRPHVSVVSVGRLARADARALVGALLGERYVAPALIERLLDRAEGVPLFVEELTRSLLDELSAGGSGAAPRGAEPSIPITLQDSLTARLDRLSSAKTVAQLAAMLGRDFPYALLEAVCDLDPAVLRSGLAQLVQADILHEQGGAPAPHYVFTHALLQDAAYQSQLRAQRRERHARIADVIEARFPRLVESEPQRLAHHCAEAQLAERAARHYQRAGQLALERLANAEAVDYFRQGLEQLAQAAESLDRHLLEIELRVALGGALAAILPVDAAEVVDNYAAVRALAERVGEGPQQLVAWIGLVGYYMQSTEFDRALEVGRAISRIAEPLDVVPLMALGKWMEGTTTIASRPLSYSLGCLAPAVEWAAAGALPPPLATHHPDMAVGIFTVAALAHAIHGDSRAAHRQLEQALVRVGELGHTATTLYGWTLACALHFQELDGERLEPRALAVAALGDERGFRHEAAQGHIYSGWCRAARGERGGADLALEGFAQYLASGSQSTLTWMTIVVADALRRAGRGAEALPHLDAAELRIARGSEIGYRTWTTWIRALIAAERGDEATAEALLRDALDLARALEAWIGVARLAAPLAELWRRRGRGAEAQALLGEALAHCVGDPVPPAFVAVREGLGAAPPA